MQRSSKTARRTPVSKQVRARIERGGARVWRMEDFSDLPFGAVAQALSRMARSGDLDRLSKGTYYRSRATPFGRSKPNPRSLWDRTSGHKHVFPSGLTAASLLGFTTQVSAKSEVATSASSLPRKLVGEETVVHTRRPWAWNELPESDAAVLEFLRMRGRTSELPPAQTTHRMLELLHEHGRYQRLLGVADTEPPRVRAMLGALGAELGTSNKVLARLRESLNPLSRFDFGSLAALHYAREWQAKDSRK